MVKLRRFMLLWMPIILWAGLIFILSGIPHLKTSLGTWDLVLRKIAHIVEYGVFCILVFRALYNGISIDINKIFWISLIISIIYAISDEYHQSFVMGRCGSLLDVMIDSIGALMGLLFIKLQKNMRHFKILKISTIMVIFSLLCGCGPNYHFKLAKLYEKKKFYAQANHHYKTVIDKYPARGAEAMFLIGENFRKDYEGASARKIYQKVIQKYPGSKWADKSMQSLMNAPDYFPFINQFLLVEGDSQTGGKIMKMYSAITVLKKRVRIKRTYYAGKNIVKELSTARYYEKKDYELREYTALNSADYSVLIKYPVEPGLRWQTKRDGRIMNFRIISTDTSVKVKAGRFVSCLKISEQDNTFKKSVKYVYYAPDVGRILTTTKEVRVGTETRISEILSYKKQVIKKKTKKKSGS